MEEEEPLEEEEELMEDEEEPMEDEVKTEVLWPAEEVGTGGFSSNLTML